MGPANQQFIPLISEKYFKIFRLEEIFHERKTAGQ